MPALNTYYRKFCAVVLMSAVVLFVPILHVYAGVPSLGGAVGPMPPHGGVIINPPWPCTCSGGIGLIVSPPTPAIVHFQPKISTLYLYYTLAPGAWVLGQHTKPLTCRWHAGPFCVPFPSQGLIYHDGTSIPGADTIDI